MKNLKISIVVPIYNIEEYLPKCIDSIINQSYKNYEIILIDDGSTDNSGKICDQYKKNNREIIVVHKKNGGLSDARNTGIDIASGDYIMFVDGDDFLFENNSIEKVLKTITNYDVDIVQYKMIYYFKDSRYMYLKDRKDDINNRTIDVLEQQISDGSYSPSACDKLIKLSIIKDNNLYFEKGLLSEDIKWSLNLMLYVNKIIISNQNIYVYRQQRSGSITTKPSNKTIMSLKSIIEYWNDYNYSSDVHKNVYLSYISYQYIILLTLINKMNCDTQTKKDIYEMKDILKYDKNIKVKMSNFIFKILGIKFGVKILKIYLYLKNSGLVRI